MATEKRLIDPERYETTLQRFEEHLTEFGKLEAAETVRSLIKGLKIAPTVDAVEVVHGRWVTDEKGITYCGRCRVIDDYASVHNYCPNCGADMR